MGLESYGLFCRDDCRATPQEDLTDGAAYDLQGFRERVFQQCPRRSQESKVGTIVLQKVVLHVEVPDARPIVVLMF
jgi:hypothetical protein